jgi:hypothetical protein
MRVIKWAVAVLVILALVGSRIGIAQDEEEAKPKHTIKEVMKAAHGGRPNLVTKVIQGEASPEEKLALLDAYLSLTENAPPKGEKESWTLKTDALVIAAAKAVVGREGAPTQLRAATNCAACHRTHRPPME